MKTVWPVMITPFHADKSVDYQGLEAVVEWYISKGVDGLFAVCQSSEMFHLTLEERVKIASLVVKVTNGRVPVVASGHISDTVPMQLEELKAIHNTGVNAVVLVTNRLAKQEEDDSISKANLETVFNAIPDCIFGLYECPYPYKRLISNDLLKFCADSGRVAFFKDTCCDIEMLKERIAITNASGLKLYNANTATLLESLRLGCDGFSGIMANFHPELYIWLTKNFESNKADFIQHFATMAGNVYCRAYPNNAKYYMQLTGVPIEHYSRENKDELFTPLIMDETEQFYKLWNELNILG